MDSTVQRINMVESQVRTADVTDRRIIRAMLDVRRELFVPEPARALAYMDGDLQVQPPPAGKEPRFLLAPRTFAKLAQLARIDPGDVVLDVGCATGYSTAVLARIAERVLGVECDRELAAFASKLISEHGGGKAKLVASPLHAGAPADGPFDVIFINGAVPEAPQTLLDQLKDGGRAVGVLARSDRAARATIWRRDGKVFDAEPAFDAGASLLPGFAKAVPFVL